MTFPSFLNWDIVCLFLSLYHQCDQDVIPLSLGRQFIFLPMTAFAIPINRYLASLHNLLRPRITTWSVRPSVHRSVRPSIRGSMSTNQSKTFYSGCFYPYLREYIFLFARPSVRVSLSQSVRRGNSVIRLFLIPVHLTWKGSWRAFESKELTTDVLATSNFHCRAIKPIIVSSIPKTPWAYRFFLL